MKKLNVPSTVLVVAGVLSSCAIGSDTTSGFDAPMLELVEDLRIDGYDADLVPISWLGVNSQGTIALFQRQDHTVRFFDTTGSLLGNVGREGEGPGEFRRPVRGGWIGDTLWVGDTQLNRITLVSPSLEVLRTIRQPGQLRSEALSGERRVFRGSEPYAVYPDGTMLQLPFSVTEGPELPEGRHPAVRVTSEGLIEQVLSWVPRGFAGVSVPVGRGTAGAAIPFGNRPDWAASPDGKYIAWFETSFDGPAEPMVEIALVDTRTSDLRVDTLPFAPETIPPAVMDSAIRERVDRREPDVARRLEHLLREAAPEFYPPVSLIRVESDGRVWLGLRRVSGVRSWALLERGEITGRVELPGDALIWATVDNHLYVTEQDDLDVESVVRYVIQ